MKPARTDGEEPSDETRAATQYVLAGGHVGTAIAERLQSAGHRVAVIDESYDSEQIPGYAGDPSDTDILSQSGVATASAVIVAARSDRQSLLIAQLVRTEFDVPRIIAFVNRPDRRPLFADVGHEPFCVTTALSETVGEIV